MPYGEWLLCKVSVSFQEEVREDDIFLKNGLGKINVPYLTKLSSYISHVGHDRGWAVEYALENH